MGRETVSPTLPSPVLAEGRGGRVCEVSLCMKCMWTAVLPRVLQGMITSQWEQLSTSMEWLLIFSLSLLHFASRMCFALSYSPPFPPRTCGPYECACVCKCKQVNTKKKKEEEQTAWMCSGYVMCISLEGRLKRRFCFPHQRPHTGGFLSFFPILTPPPPLTTRFMNK